MDKKIAALKLCRQNGFTIIELLVVIAIIGILAGLITVGMAGSLERARIAKIQGFSSTLRTALMGNRISEWKFDEGMGTTTADTVGTNTGTLLPALGPAWKSGAECVSGGCLSFDGVNDYVDVGNVIDANIDGTNSKTITAWIKPSSIQVGDHIVTKWTTAATGAGWQFNFGTALKLEFWARNSAATDWNYIANSANFTTGKWQHAVVTINAGVIKLYKDGTEVSGTYLGSALDATNALSVQIGTRRGSSAEFFDGSIDEVRIYNAALTASAIRGQYLAGLDKLLAIGEITQKEYQEKLLKLDSTYAANK
ncbi:MAG: LamG-like jellyroll fold domain-containing protein [Candidatus Paceibacterota bacterium]|jgi:prepilin-type N-terminal cleavage/methylation domain-containing protein